jgi:hypothetical protein
MFTNKQVELLYTAQSQTDTKSNVQLKQTTI